MTALPVVAAKECRLVIRARHKQQADAWARVIQEQKAWRQECDDQEKQLLSTPPTDEQIIRMIRQAAGMSTNPVRQSEQYYCWRKNSLER